MFGRRKPEIAPAPPPPPSPEPAEPSLWPRHHKTNARVSRTKLLHSPSNYGYMVVIIDNPDESGGEIILTLTLELPSHPALATVEEGDRLSLELYQYSERHAWTVSKGHILFDPDKERARFESKSQPIAER